MKLERYSLGIRSCITLMLALMWLACGAAAAAPASPTESAQTKPGSKQSELTPRAKAVTAAETYEGMPVGFTKEGLPFRGNVDATLTLVEYTDYVCPFCARYFQQTLPVLLEKYGRNGQVKFVVDDFPLDSLHPTAPQGAAAATCVAEQGSARFWQMHDALFKGQQEWNRLPDPTGFLAEVAKKTGANMNAYRQCMASGRVKAQVEQRVAASKALGFTGTPTFQFVQQKTGKTYTLVGAQPPDVFATWIDALLAGNEPPQAQKPAKSELPEWAKAGGLAPDPKRPGFTLAGDPYKGNPNAKLVLVEFGDFQCPSCQRHVLATQPELDRRFVDSGDVLWVVKHFPLRIHPNAPVAAAAAECAGDQGKFWAMHHLLYERADQWSSVDDADAAFGRLASELKLDSTGFNACLKGRAALERVLRDLYDGQAIGVRNIPTFILLHGGTSYVLTGARSTEQFAATLEQQLDAAKLEAKSADTLANR